MTGRTRAPMALYVVVSDAGNPHSNGPIQTFTTRRAADRACRWGDQRVITYVPGNPTLPCASCGLLLGDPVLLEVDQTAHTAPRCRARRTPVMVHRTCGQPVRPSIENDDPGEWWCPKCDAGLASSDVRPAKASEL